VGFWLDLAPNEPVFHTVCLHFENGVPVQLEDRYVNARVVAAFLDQDFSVEPPGEYLARNVPFDQIEHVVDAVLPTAQQALQLEMAPGGALPAAHAPHLDAGRRGDDGALLASGLALSAGQPLPRRRASVVWLKTARVAHTFSLAPTCIDRFTCQAHTPPHPKPSRPLRSPRLP
jgi:hypothetical protein